MVGEHERLLHALLIPELVVYDRFRDAPSIIVNFKYWASGINGLAVAILLSIHFLTLVRMMSVS
jgi:hypothetical protein